MTVRHDIQGAHMHDTDVDPDNLPPVSESDYEPPTIFDFGAVFATTRGSSGGSSDTSGQGAQS
jgi:hypothetical protein